MPKWTPYISGERAVVVGGDYIYCYALTHEESVKFAAAHNADIDALTADRDEIQRRLDAVVASLKPGPEPDRQLTNIPNHTDSDLIWSEWHRQANLHARACEIAGRASDVWRMERGDTETTRPRAGGRVMHLPALDASQWADIGRNEMLGAPAPKENEMEPIERIASELIKEDKP